MPGIIEKLPTRAQAFIHRMEVAVANKEFNRHFEAACDARDKWFYTHDAEARDRMQRELRLVATFGPLAAEKDPKNVLSTHRAILDSEGGIVKLDFHLRESLRTQVGALADQLDEPLPFGLKVEKHDAT